MKIHDFLSALLRFIAAGLVASLLFSLAPIVTNAFLMDDGQRTASLIEAAATGLLGGIVWIYHRDLVRWLLLPHASPMVQGVRMASFIVAIGIFAQTLGRSIYWGSISPDDGAYVRLLMGSRGSTVSDITIFIIATALLFLSPHIENYVDELRVRSLIKAEIDAKSDSAV